MLYILSKALQRSLITVVDILRSDLNIKLYYIKMALNWKTFDISKLSFSEAKRITFGELTYHRIYITYAYNTEQGGVESGE